VEIIAKLMKGLVTNSNLSRSTQREVCDVVSAALAVFGIDVRLTKPLSSPYHLNQYFLAKNSPLIAIDSHPKVVPYAACICGEVVKIVAVVNCVCGMPHSNLLTHSLCSDGTIVGDPIPLRCKYVKAPYALSPQGKAPCNKPLGEFLRGAMVPIKPFFYSPIINWIRSIAARSDFEATFRARFEFMRQRGG
jgi:hypothetical protein